MESTALARAPPPPTPLGLFSIIGFVWFSLGWYLQPPAQDRRAHRLLSTGLRDVSLGTWELGAFREWGLLSRATPLSSIGHALLLALLHWVWFSLGWYLEPPPHPDLAATQVRALVDEHVGPDKPRVLVGGTSLVLPQVRVRCGGRVGCLVVWV